MEGRAFMVLDYFSIDSRLAHCWHVGNAGTDITSVTGTAGDREQLYEDLFLE
jgi:hypothetical protein